MPRKSDLLDRLHVQTPCEADWDSMSGGDRLRFCDHCQRSVNDLSRMTRKEALRLVADSGGRLCVRYVRLPDGTVRTAEVTPAPLYRIARRASRIAAGAFGAALTLTAGAAATQAQTAGRNVEQGRIEAKAAAPGEAAEAGRASLAGRITDTPGAVVPSVSVTLTNARTGETRFVSSDGEGAYRFQDIAPGVYSLKFQLLGFAEHEVADVSVQAGGESRVDATLEPRFIETMTMGVVAFVEPQDPLVKAAYQNDLPAVKRLLSEGHDANALDKAVDATALEEAVGHGNLKMVRALVAAGADVNQENRAGRTALMALDGEATPEVVRALLDAGAEVKVRDDEGNTALTYAAASCSAEVIRQLLDAGAKVNSRNDEGRTPLMFAAELGALEAVRALVAAGADYNLKDEAGKSALYFAREGEHQDVVTFLVIYGAAEGDAEAKEEQASQP